MQKSSYTIFLFQEIMQEFSILGKDADWQFFLRILYAGLSFDIYFIKK